MTLKPFEFGPEGLAWVRKCLSGGNTLSKLLLKLPLETGRVYTYLPDGLAPSRRTMFESGGIFGKTGSELDRRWRTEVRSYLSASEDRVCIVEDIAQVDEAGLDTSDEAFFSYGKEVYDYLTYRGQDLNRIRFTMSKGRQYPSVHLLTKIPEGATIHQRQEVSRHVLEELAANASRIMVGAYDEESYLVLSAGPKH